MLKGSGENIPVTKNNTIVETLNEIQALAYGLYSAIETIHSNVFGPQPQTDETDKTPDCILDHLENIRRTLRNAAEPLDEIRSKIG